MLLGNTCHLLGVSGKEIVSPPSFHPHVCLFGSSSMVYGACLPEHIYMSVVFLYFDTFLLSSPIFPPLSSQLSIPPHSPSIYRVLTLSTTFSYTSSQTRPGLARQESETVIDGKDKVQYRYGNKKCYADPSYKYPQHPSTACFLFLQSLPCLAYLKSLRE